MEPKVVCPLAGEGSWRLATAPRRSAHRHVDTLTPGIRSIIIIRVYLNRPPVSIAGLAAIVLPAAISLAAAPARPVSFSDQLYPVLQKAGCRMCHNPEGVASPTRLRFPEEG